MNSQTIGGQSCQTCKHEHTMIYKYPCKNCVDSKRWIRFAPVVNFSQWEPKDGKAT